MMSYWVLFGVIMLTSWLVSNRLKSKFTKYSKVSISANLTGKEVAERMLKENGIYDVRVISTDGELTDHYDPTKKTVNLSREIYENISVSSAAVAAHECGHAVQHANAYSFLQMRTALVPVVSFSSKWVQWILLAGILMLHSFPSLLLIGIILFAMTTLFSFITLPVEIDASRRALAWLNNSGITTGSSHTMAQDALKWAAYTYVVAALASLGTLMYYLMIYLGGRRN